MGWASNSPRPRQIQDKSLCILLVEMNPESASLDPMRQVSSMLVASRGDNVQGPTTGHPAATKAWLVGHPGSPPPCSYPLLSVAGAAVGATGAEASWVNSWARAEGGKYASVDSWKNVACRRQSLKPAGPVTETMET